MRVIGWDGATDYVEFKKEKISLTIGVFDGVHTGHQKIIEHLTKKNDYMSVVLTFTDNPRKKLSPVSFPGNIQSLDQKLAAFYQLGIDTVILIDFSIHFSKLTGDDFLVRLLEKLPCLEYIVLGYNFHCGYKGDTNVYQVKNILTAKDIVVNIVPSVFENREVVSSSRIRKLIQNSEINEVSALMKRPYELDIKNIPCIYKKGRLVLDRNNITQVLPSNGRYPVSIRTNNNSDYRTELLVDNNNLYWKPRENNSALYIQFETV